MNKDIKKLLNEEAKKRDDIFELSFLAAPDPLHVAKPHNDEYIALICALFAYGNAKHIKNFLHSLDFSALDSDQKELEGRLKGQYYRFQTNNDVVQLFKTLSILKKECSLEDIFLQGYKKEFMIIDGLRSLILKLYEVNSYSSKGYEFLLGKVPQENPKSAYKRLNLFLRWMVREDNIDMGLWKRVDKSDLLMPLDVHTFNLGKKLGLINRKSYDFKAVLELTKSLKKLDKNDPIKYDFALYRLGQSRALII